MASVTGFVTSHYEHRFTVPCLATAWRLRCLCSVSWLPAVWAPSYWPGSATAWLSQRLCLILTGPVTSVTLPPREQTFSLGLVSLAAFRGPLQVMPSPPRGWSFNLCSILWALLREEGQKRKEKEREVKKRVLRSLAVVWALSRPDSTTAWFGRGLCSSISAPFLAYVWASRGYALALRRTYHGPCSWVLW